MSLSTIMECNRLNCMIQDIVLERLAGIKREYGELDTVWFMAGSLFKVLIYR